MQEAESLNQIKQQIILLDENEKRDLAEFLAGELRNSNADANRQTVSKKEQEKQLEWLKENREKYAGKYIALSGDKLVGEGKTFREARRQAQEKGFQNPFVTYVYSETDVPFGGW
jgi:phage repressor protein C with HTH and peptisase S24 domain